MRIFIIAEAGVNHNGGLNTAIDMVNAAADCGADAVKFQTFFASKIVSKSAKTAQYQKNNVGADSQFEMLQKLELGLDDFKKLKRQCVARGIHFMSTAFDLESVDFIDSLDVAFHKIPSGEITNLPYLIKLAQTKRPLFLSTGMSTMQEIKDALGILKSNGSGEITLLHCNTEYPTPMRDVNLRAMETLKLEFGCAVGYSDHTAGIEAAIAAAALGARVIEKHFTLDKQMIGPDHAASLEPSELKAMILAIRNIEMALGSPFKEPTPSESKNILIARRSITAKTFIRKGELLTEKNITLKRPGDGISPMKWFDVLGTRAIRDFDEDELIVL